MGLLDKILSRFVSPIDSGEQYPPSAEIPQKTASPLDVFIEAVTHVVSAVETGRGAVSNALWSIQHPLEVAQRYLETKLELKRWQPHLDINKRNINRAADSFLQHWYSHGQSERPRLAVLGVGQGHDIDLTYLSHFFDLTLVDYREDALSAASKKIPPAFRERVNLVADDITGGVSDFFLRAGLSNIRNPEALRFVLKQVILSSEKKHLFEWEQPPHFIVSSMVTSQLALFPRDLLAEAHHAVTQGYLPPDLFKVRPGTPMAQLQGNLISSHVAALLEWVQKGAWVYLASDVDAQDKAVSDQELPLLFEPDGEEIQALEDTIPQGTNCLVHEFPEWQWNLEEGVVHNVSAMVLAPSAVGALPLLSGFVGR